MVRPRVTIAQIADEAGVSLPTVSKVLNGRSDVSAETRAKVERLMRHHGYRRQRTSGVSSSPMVDLVFHDLGSPWAVELIRGVEAEADRQGVEVVITETGAGRAPQQGWVDSVLRRKPAGVVLVMSGLVAEQRARLEARRIPYVTVDPQGDDPGGPSIGCASFRGGYLATRHLLELGHRRVATITGPTGALASRLRLAGYREALTEAGVPVTEELVRPGAWGFPDGYAEGQALLGLPQPPTAVFAGSDLQAMGVVRAAADQGLRVPDDISVVGFDDLPLVQWLNPPLTTVRQPLVEMAETATRMVLQLSRGEQPPATSLELAVELVVRASTAPA